MAVPMRQIPTQNSLQYTLDAGYTAGGTVLTLSSTLTGIVQAPGVCVVDRVDSSGNKTASKRDYFTFSGVSGTTLTGCSGGQAGSTNQDHAVGAIVEFIPDVIWAQSVYDTISAEHSTSGVHSTTYVVTPTGTQALTNKTITDSTNNVMAKSLKSASTTVDVSAATAPSSGQVLTATSTTTATWQTPTSPMTDAGAYVKPTTDGDEIRAYHSDGTSYIEMGNDGTNSVFTSGTGHIDLVPATSKLVRKTTRHQADTTNTYKGLVVVEHGWGFVTGAGTDRKATKTVTLPTAFTTILSVNLTPLGFKDSSDPTVITDFGDGYYDLSAGVSNITTSNFIAFVVNTQGTNLDNGRRFGFSWEVKGIL